MQAVANAAVVQGAAPPRLFSKAAKPSVGYEVAYVTSAVLMVRREPTAEDSFAAIRDRRRFGMAMAAMIRMIATTISNSIREKPFCFFMMLDLLEKFLWYQSTPSIRQARNQSRLRKSLPSTRGIDEIEKVMAWATGDERARGLRPVLVHFRSNCGQDRAAGCGS